MAITNSNAVGKANKSAGQNTYRTVRGRVIMSQRITTNKSQTPLQIDQRGKFKTGSTSISRIAFYINRAYDKSKYGSQRNNFYTQNKAMLLGLFPDGEIPLTPYAVLDAMVNAGLKFVTYGEGNVIVTVPDGTDDNVATSIDFAAYNVAQDECKAEVITIVNNGEVHITDVSRMVDYDAVLQRASLMSELLADELPTLQTGQTAYDVIVFRTAAGIAKCQYLMQRTGA